MQTNYEGIYEQFCTGPSATLLLAKNNKLSTKSQYWYLFINYLIIVSYSNVHPCANHIVYYVSVSFLSIKASLKQTF